MVINRLPPSAVEFENAFPTDRRTAGVNSPLSPRDVTSDTSNSHYSGEDSRTERIGLEERNDWGMKGERNVEGKELMRMQEGRKEKN